VSAVRDGTDAVVQQEPHERPDGVPGSSHSAVSSTGESALLRNVLVFRRRAVIAVARELGSVCRRAASASHAAWADLDSACRACVSGVRREGVWWPAPLSVVVI
jgi:hypothetical protein